jgi:hypothetical protein
MFKRWRLFLALLLIGTAFGLRVSWLRRDIWNMDEGTTFTMAQQVRAGAVLYRDAADNRTPLVPYLKAAVLVVAGDWNARAVHVVVALLVGGAAVLLWQIARRLGDEVAGIAGAVACTAISFLLLDPMDALAAHTEWFMVFFTIPGYWFFVRSLERPGYWAGWPAGVCFGLACLCKQPAVFDLGVTLVLCGLLGPAGSGAGRWPRWWPARSPAWSRCSGQRWPGSPARARWAIWCSMPGPTTRNTTCRWWP